MAKDTYRSQFRLPYDLYEMLKESSEANRRSQALGDFLGRNERPDETKGRDTEPS